MLLRNQLQDQLTIILRSFAVYGYIAIDAQNMNFTVVKLNGKEVPFIDKAKIQLIYPFEKEK
jgi:hypothetical protein